MSSSALFQTRGLNLAIVSSRSVILTPTIVYISARVTTNNRVCSTIDYCSVFSNRYVLNDGPYTFLNSEALVTVCNKFLLKVNSLLGRSILQKNILIQHVFTFVFANGIMKHFTFLELGTFLWL